MNDRITDFGRAVLEDRYLSKGETIPQRFRTIADHYSDDKAHADRMYEHITNHWFMPATPILSNGGTNRGLPISCFLNSVQDSMDGITDVWSENSHLSAAGGGVGSCWSNVRSIHETTRNASNSSGIIPFIHVMDSISLAVNQGSLRRGAASVYLDVSHPEIEEFLDIRKQTGDFNRRSLNLHQGITIPDMFMHAVLKDSPWDLIAPSNYDVVKTISARRLWEKILETRLQTGEPYLVWTDKTDTSNIRKLLGHKVTQSNLCSEIMLHTGPDYLNRLRTAVCCLGSLNLVYWSEWKQEVGFIRDCLSFLDNVLSEFIKKTDGNPKYTHANYSAKSERSVGLGVMGFHSLLQQEKLPFDSIGASDLNRDIFGVIKHDADKANRHLARKKGRCPDAIEVDTEARFTHLLAIAPTANISIIAGGCSPCIEPWNTNLFIQKTLSGSFEVKNRNLEKELEKLRMNNVLIWASIIANQGSVQQLRLPQEIKEVYKTAFEIDQQAIIGMAADRAKFIDQGQSVNIFLPADISKKDLNTLHLQAWKGNIKSLYYCRTQVINRAESINQQECQVCQ